MSREILFRGQRKSDRAWIYGNLLRTDDGIFIIQNHVPYHLLSKYEVLQETVCEYTGLTDKNGRKIFEGDVVAWRREDIILTGNYTYCFNGYKYGDELIVRCLGSGFMLCRKNDGLPDVPNANDKIDNYAFWNNHRFLEVIGNIFDNPKLLEGGEAE